MTISQNCNNYKIPLGTLLKLAILYIKPLSLRYQFLMYVYINIIYFILRLRFVLFCFNYIQCIPEMTITIGATILFIQLSYLEVYICLGRHDYALSGIQIVVEELRGRNFYVIYLSMKTITNRNNFQTSIFDQLTLKLKD